MVEDRRLPSLRRDTSCISRFDIQEIIARKAWYDVLFGFNLARFLKFSCNSIAAQMSFIASSFRKWQSQIQLMLQTTCQAHLCPSAFYHYAVSGNNPLADMPEHTNTHTHWLPYPPLRPICLHPQQTCCSSSLLGDLTEGKHPPFIPNPGAQACQRYNRAYTLSFLQTTWSFPVTEVAYGCVISQHPSFHAPCGKPSY